ncbi:hypothetical protein BOBR111200_23175 [Bordetella bronchialis]
MPGRGLSDMPNRKLPSSASRMKRGPSYPRAASSAAVTPASADRPGCMRLLMPPSAVKAHKPADCVPASPSALAVVEASRPRITLAAAAAAKVPVVPVRCHPRMRVRPGLAAWLTRFMVS